MPKTSTPTYHAPERGRTVVITAGAVIPEAVGAGYTHGDNVDPFRVAAATLRDIARLDRTSGGRVSANAKKAKAELARRALNKAARKSA